MARVDKKRELRPSILDRLLDDEPHNQTESGDQRHQLLKDLRNSVRRDLENLFNTRYRIKESPEELEELEDSLVNYGLPDLATINLIDGDAKNKFVRFLESTIRHFEPRFKDVQVVVLNNADVTDRTLRFRIEATLYAEPQPEIVTFDSVMEPVTRTVSIHDLASYD